MTVEGDVLIKTYSTIVIVICYKKWDTVWLGNVKTGKKLGKNVKWERNKLTISDLNELRKHHNYYNLLQSSDC
jgi:hypothetical protein